MNSRESFAAACDQSGRLAELLAGALDASAEQQLAAHVAQCAACQSEYERQAALLLPREGLRPELPLPFAAASQADTQTRSADTHAGTRAAAAAAPALPERFGRYRILRLVGAGGMGRVYEAEDERLRRTVAIKVLAPHLVADPQARERLLREAQAAAALVHDNIVPLHGVEDHDGAPYLVMQFIQGESLQQRLDRGEASSTADVARIGREIASALAAAHARGLIHRDVKPGNILIEGLSGRARITDFGLVRAQTRPENTESLTEWGVIAGTPAYMAPEQARGEPFDARVDLYGLGGVLFALCSGGPPSPRQQTAPQPATISPAALDWSAAQFAVPTWLRSVIERLLAPTPAERFASAIDVQRALERGAARANSGRRLTLTVLTIAAGMAAISVVSYLGIERLRVPHGSAEGQATTKTPAASEKAAAMRAVDSTEWKDCLRRAEIRINARDLPGLTEVAERLIVLDSQQADGYFYRGYAAYHQGHWTSARADFERAVARMPDHAPALAGLVAILVQGPKELRDSAAAIPLAERALAHDSRQGLVHLHLAAALLREGRTDEAADVLTTGRLRMYRANPAFSHILFAQCYSRRGDPQAATEYFRLADEAWGPEGTKLNEQLREQFFEWRSEAAALLIAAGRAPPTAAAPAVADSRGRAGPDSAPRPQRSTASQLADLNARLQANPNDVSALTTRASLLSNSGKLAESLADAERAVQLAPHQANAWYVRGLSYERLGQEELALRDFLHAAELDPKNRGANRMAATVLLLGSAAQRDAQRGLQFATATRELMPQDPSSWYLVGVAEYRRGEFAKAIDTLEQSRRLQRGTEGPSAQFFLAMAQQQTGQPLAAKSNFDRAAAWFEDRRPSVGLYEIAVRVHREAAEALGLPPPAAAEKPAAVKDREDQTRK